MFNLVRFFESIQDIKTISKYLANMDHDAIMDTFEILEYCNPVTQERWEKSYYSISL